MTLKIEWVCDFHIMDAPADPARTFDPDADVPVVRLEQVDAVIGEVVWAMEIVMFRIQYKNDKPSQTFNELEELCMKDSGYRRAQAFLASPLVAEWWQRQERHGQTATGEAQGCHSGDEDSRKP